MGGYVAAKKVIYEEAIRLLEQEAYAIDPSDFRTNKKAIIDGLENGMQKPIFDDHKELEKEGFENHNINKWFNQGVLLLNTALTVETGNPGSHLKYWEQFSEEVIKRFSKDNPCIWILWGKHAQNFQRFIYKPVDTNLYDMKDIYHIPIDPECNYILKSAHPAAETYAGGKAGFYGNNHFLKSNVLLKLFNKKEIEW